MSPATLLRLTALVLLGAPAALSSFTVDCSKLVDLSGHKYDLSPLADLGAQSVNRTRDTPPSQIEDMIRFDLCKSLPSDSDLGKEDQCPPGTRGCLTMTNHKPNHGDMITQVITLAKSEATASASISGTDGLTLVFTGSSYPPDTSDSKPQHLNVTFRCSTESSDPTFSSYDGSTAVVDWIHSAGCAKKDGDNGDSPTEDDGKEGDEKGETERMGSGIGWFFLVLLLALGAYFGVGMYYNYSTYGATGYDLIPHRDFWREVPYMLRDVTAHLCSSVRSRPTSRGGYVAV